MLAKLSPHLPSGEEKLTVHLGVNWAAPGGELWGSGAQGTAHVLPSLPFPFPSFSGSRRVHHHAQWLYGSLLGIGASRCLL